MSNFIEPSILEKLLVRDEQEEKHKHPIILFSLFLLFPTSIIIYGVFLFLLVKVIGIVPLKKKHKSSVSKEQLDHLARTFVSLSLFNIMFLYLARDDFHNQTPYYILLWIMTAITPVLLYMSKQHEKNTNISNTIRVFIWLQIFYLAISVIYFFLFLLGWFLASMVQ